MTASRWFVQTILKLMKVFDWFGSESKARLTGTGACVFCPYQDEKSAQDIGAIIAKSLVRFCS